VPISSNNISRANIFLARANTSTGNENAPKHRKTVI
jgi:hypothetical protein